MNEPDERVVMLAVGGDALPAVLSGAACAGDVGVVVVVGGPQYRVGSHRQFVLLARALATAGVPTLRFDVRGMGDAEGESRPFESLDADIGEAIDSLLRSRPALRRVVLWGLCDGASAALLYLHARRDPRICGLVLVNPWVRSEQSEARTRVRHYYLDRLRQPAFWRKLLQGGVATRALREFAGNVRRSRAQPPSTPRGPLAFQDRMAAALRSFDGPTLLLLSERDYTAREFDAHAAASGPWKGVLARTNMVRIDLEGADHTCSSAAHRNAVEGHTVRWLHAHFTPASPDGAAMETHHGIA